MYSCLKMGGERIIGTLARTVAGWAERDLDYPPLPGGSADSEAIQPLELDAASQVKPSKLPSFSQVRSRQ
jgi:hypothetical protein